MRTLGVLASGALLFGCSTNGASSVMGAASAASATAPMAAATVDNFMLVDQNLEAHELYRLADAKAVVLVTQANGDGVMRGLAPALKALKASYGDKGVEFLMLNSSLKDSREAVIAEAKAAGYDAPILLDVNQLVGEQLGVTRSAEVVVVDPKTWTVAWRGALDARSTAQALDAVIAGKPVQTAGVTSRGAIIAFPERGLTKVSYARDVAPILEAKCVACHQEGGIGPFAMTNYQMVKGFAPMIREVLRTDRMPPYNADPHVGKFSDSKNLSSAEIKTLVHWIEAGAQRGEGPDPLGAVKHVAQEWPLGKPDLVLNVPAYTIPATGVVDYQRPFIVNPLTAGKWVRASTFKVEQRQGVHHFLTGYLPEIPKDGKAYESGWGSSVGSYAVGAESEISPANVGAFLPAGGAIGIQAHYTPFGREVTDHSQIALYFYADDKTPAMVMHNSVIIDNSIVVPANDPRHREVAYLEFAHAALLYSAFPHAHYRAYSSDLWIRYPDGKQKLLLSLPRYDFNWQRDYTFAEPIKVPAGSKLIAHYVYDNSRRNPSNPDPNKTIGWGDQSWDEMLFTRIRYRWADETSDKLKDYDTALNDGRLMGMLDDNLDGKVEKAELKGLVGVRISGFFAALDRNHDGAIDRAELALARKMMSQAPERRAAASPSPAGTPGS